MEYFGVLLYSIFAALVLWFISRARGHSLSELLDASGHEHHIMHAVAQKHPRGGNWNQHRQWAREESSQGAKDHV